MSNVTLQIPIEDITDAVRAVMRSEFARERELNTKLPPPAVRRLTVKKAAERFGFSEKQLRNRIHQRTIPVHRERSSVYFLEHEIEQWLKETR